MRRTESPSEILRLTAPVFRVLDATWKRMHWWVAAMAVLYVFSGVTVVRPDEVAVILRWGRLVGDTPALQEHGPGLLFAFPRPIDRVVRVPAKHVYEVSILTLADASGRDADSASLDPVSQGYAVTADQNIVHVRAVARYRVRDAAEWAFYGPKADDVLRVEVTSALVRSMGEMGVDRVLSDGRKDLVATATRRAQQGLDRVRAGLELSSLELTELAPPKAVAGDFAKVQTAFITAETQKNEAQAYAESTIPKARADADAAVRAARGGADAALAAANGAGAAFTALAREYRDNPAVVRERLYRNAVEQAIGKAGSVRWVPPPTGGSYRGLTITIRQSMTSTPSSGE